MHKIHSKTTLLVMALSFTSIFAGDNEPAPRITTKASTAPIIAGLTTARDRDQSRGGQVTSPRHLTPPHILSTTTRRQLIPPFSQHN